MIDVSIIILSYNHFDMLNKTIKGIISKVKLVNYEIIIIDNASTDGDINEYLVQNQKIKIFKNVKNIGWPAAINQGLSYAQGKYICIIDNDVLLLDDVLSYFLTLSRSYDDTAIFAPRVVDGDNNLQTSAEDFPTIVNQVGMAFFLSALFPSFKFLNSWHIVHQANGNIIPVDMVIGACMFFPKFIASNINGFESKYFFYYSDTDFCLMHKKNNGKVLYCPAVSVIHYGGVATKGTKLNGNHHFAKDTITFYKKNYPGWKAFIFITLNIISSLNRFIVWGTAGLFTFNKSLLIKAYYLLIRGLIVARNAVISVR
jgi:GT2 family glycosyltransferase